MATLIVFCAHGSISRGLENRLEILKIKERIKAIHPTALLRSTKILMRVLDTCCYSDSCERPSAYAGVKKTRQIEEIIMIK